MRNKWNILQYLMQWLLEKYWYMYYDREMWYRLYILTMENLHSISPHGYTWLCWREKAKSVSAVREILYREKFWLFCSTVILLLSPAEAVLWTRTALWKLAAMALAARKLRNLRSYRLRSYLLKAAGWLRLFTAIGLNLAHYILLFLKRLKLRKRLAGWLRKPYWQ